MKHHRPAIALLKRAIHLLEQDSSSISLGSSAKDVDGRPCNPCSQSACAWSLRGLLDRVAMNGSAIEALKVARSGVARVTLSDMDGCSDKLQAINILQEAISELQKEVRVSRCKSEWHGGPPYDMRGNRILKCPSCDGEL